VATALAEQRPDLVAALALIDTGPDSDAFIPQGLLSRLLLAPLPGRLLWPLRTEATIRKAMRTAFTRPVDIPDALIEDARGMTPPRPRGDEPRILELPQAAEPSRQARRAGRTGAGDLRHRRPPVAFLVGYRLRHRARRRVELLPGVGHTPMLEDPQTTGRLLLDFAATAGSTPRS
jgi:pimeloyl-ACP methyl ester carboxylesterase